MNSDFDSKNRFSNRVDDYVKYRPDYPREIISMFHERIGLQPDWKIADVGCGTGISCRMFLENGNEVFGVEPNDDMRQAAIDQFAGQSRFHPIKGSAEATGLSDRSVDLVVVAQAFHWLDKSAAAKEFKRILRSDPGGYVAVIWNSRLATPNPFAIEYDALLTRWGTDYKQVAHRTPMSVEEFVAIFAASFERIVLSNYQCFTLEGLMGRARSSSYTPTPGEPGHNELFAGIHDIFHRFQQRGEVRFKYDTEIFLGNVCNRK